MRRLAAAALALALCAGPAALGAQDGRHPWTVAHPTTVYRESDGESCNAGDQCCGGYCVQGPSGPVCAQSSKGCANEYDKCTTSGDCCKGYDCINGKCATPPPR